MLDIPSDGAQSAAAFSAVVGSSLITAAVLGTAAYRRYKEIGFSNREGFQVPGTFPGFPFCGALWAILFQIRHVTKDMPESRRSQYAV